MMLLDFVSSGCHNIEGGIAIPVRNLGIWPNIVGIEEEGSELEIVENWSTDKGGERKVTNTETI